MAIEQFGKITYDDIIRLKTGNTLLANVDVATLPMTVSLTDSILNYKLILLSLKGWGFSPTVLPSSYISSFFGSEDFYFCVIGNPSGGTRRLEGYFINNNSLKLLSLILNNYFDSGTGDVPSFLGLSFQVWGV